MDTSKIIAVGGEGIILDSGNYKYDLDKDDPDFDKHNQQMNGKPTCTKYTLNLKSSDILYNFGPERVDDGKMPPEYVSTKINSDFIIRNLEIYICKPRKDIFIGTGKPKLKK